MSRKGTSSLLLVSLTVFSLGLGLGCSQGGPLDPLDNVGGSNVTPMPPGVTTDLPDCSETGKAPCKLTISNLGFTEDAGCTHKNDMGAAISWNHPNGDTARVQFGASESTLMQACSTYEQKICDMTLNAVPSLFNTMQAGKIRLTFTEKHKLFLITQTSGTTVNGSAAATGTLRVGGKDVLTLAGTRTGNGGSLEAAQLTAWLEPGANRNIGLRVNTSCGQVFSPSLPIFWSVEGMIAEMLP